MDLFWDNISNIDRWKHRFMLLFCCQPPGDVYISILLDMELINCLQLTVDAYTVQRSIAGSKSAKVKLEKMFVESPKHLIVHPKVDMDGQLSTELLRLESVLPQVRSHP